ncbi:pyridoxal-phosphate dependent enzyme [Phytoactinopolyspora alkaliphila]|uniref:Pyridoxal-phosphate dependent enzyme n=1 Tax=Phytoactinopolyspora alkaliphila TaxID=1783498 RepID=A0A6N9YIR1_9ACTN|nr:pyridoxal-phosphate dependent enzyme [Phytoactinopolyspora alkaliphila]NED94759.1 pyridoxal-phosphate dependent enzyme [Phytoactinopolyspora alkaliphila]
MNLAPHGLSRFADDLPDVGGFVTLGEGGTPVVELHHLAAELGLERLSAKMETANPTGSYKDRVAAISVSLARDRGYRGWIATSSGNAGLAMAAYGARAHLPGFLCVVSSAPQEKRLPLMPFGIGLVAVDGVGDGASRAGGTQLMDQVRDAAEQHKLFLGITANAFNPEGMRGIDTIGYELAEQIPSMTHVYLPTGGGGLLASTARGLTARSVQAAVVACQPSGCAPIARYLSGELSRPVVDRCETLISALQLPHPPDGQLAVDAVRASQGWGTHTDDAAILAAQQRLAETEGIFVEPAAAVGLAALLTDLDRGRIDAGHHPVLLLTGAGWKDQNRFTAQAARIPAVDVDGVPAAIENWIRSR